MSIETWLDCLVAALLAVAIFYCFSLNRRLETLRSAQSELRHLLTTFGETTTHAEQGIAGVRLATQELVQELDERTVAARALGDELLVMTRSGNDVAERLEQAALRRSDEEAPARPHLTVAASSEASESERELLHALRKAR